MLQYILKEAIFVVSSPVPICHAWTVHSSLGLKGHGHCSSATTDPEWHSRVALVWRTWEDSDQSSCHVVVTVAEVFYKVQVRLSWSGCDVKLKAPQNSHLHYFPSTFPRWYVGLRFNWRTLLLTNKQEKRANKNRIFLRLHFQKKTQYKITGETDL